MTPAPTTFLEYVCSKMFGPPWSSRGDGQSKWPCPQCCDREFHTRPYDPRFADKFSCYRCGWWGNEFDAVWFAFPDTTYPQRQLIVERLRAEFERGRGLFLSLPGTQRDRRVAEAWRRMMGYLRDEEMIGSPSRELHVYRTYRSMVAGGAFGAPGETAAVAMSLILDHWAVKRAEDDPDNADRWTNAV